MPTISTSTVLQRAAVFTSRGHLIADLQRERLCYALTRRSSRRRRYRSAAFPESIFRKLPQPGLLLRFDPLADDGEVALYRC